MGVLNKLKRGRVVSCQPVDDGPMDSPQFVAAFAKAAEIGGACGLRIEGLENLAAVRSVTKLPIIGIVKHDLPYSPVRISPHLEDVEGLVANGADIIAYDATERERPVPTSQIVRAIVTAGKIAMADCATLTDARAAMSEGAKIIGTTLSGYAYEMAPDGAGPDLELIASFRELEVFVMAEGRLNTPELARLALIAGADSVTVGSAITRVEHITGWFAQAVQQAADE